MQSWIDFIVATSFFKNQIDFSQIQLIFGFAGSNVFLLCFWSLPFIIQSLRDSTGSTLLVHAVVWGA